MVKVLCLGQILAVSRNLTETAQSPRLCEAPGREFRLYGESLMTKILGLGKVFVPLSNIPKTVQDVSRIKAVDREFLMDCEGPAVVLLCFTQIAAVQCYFAKAI